ncbi:complex I subunit 5 family protein [Atopococcus tabaci]|uniref:complex I subunit 5 family protein n=1 Tax=Atopococcus tabaci TaxID=269774 RepID=UPI00240A5507|nr:proton-conducting transporter membrane subunit [Atopococcus tabaci]
MLYLYVLAPILVGLLAYILRRNQSASFVLVLFQALDTLAVVGLFWQVRQTGTIVNNIGGWPDGMAITLYVDQLAAAMLLMTSILFLFFILFSYKQNYFTAQFFFLFMVLQGLLNGLFLTNDLFNIFVLLEVSTVTVSVLIMFNKEKQAIYDGMIYFFVNVIGSAFLLFGIGFIYKTFGLLDIRAIGQSMELVENSRAVIIPYALMFTTLSLKTAVMPLFSWLPKAHGTPSAPPVVSAFLSGLYIKIGVYLSIRFSDMFGSAIDMQNFFFVLGFFTSVIGFVLALSQKDIKLILAYHTVSQVGLIIVALNMDSEIAFWGGVYHIFNHALFKSALFLTAGLIYNVYGTRNVYEIRGVMRKMPLVGVATLFAILGITGAPFFNGSLSKYMIAHGTNSPVVAAMLNLINLGTITSFVKYSTMLFGRDTGKEANLDRYSQWSALGLGIMSLLTGVFGRQTIRLLFDYSLTVSQAEYFQKGVVYFVMIAAAVLLYRGPVKNSKLLNKAGAIEFTFNGTITAVALYFVGLLGFLLVTV